MRCEQLAPASVALCSSLVPVQPPFPPFDRFRPENYDYD